MRRIILRLAILCVILFPLASSARAQATGSDCSQSNQPTTSWNQDPPDPPDPLCSGSYALFFVDIGIA